MICNRNCTYFNITPCAEYVKARKKKNVNNRCLLQDMRRHGIILALLLQLPQLTRRGYGVCRKICNFSAESIRHSGEPLLVLDGAKGTI
jgi:hypothetical protein